MRYPDHDLTGAEWTAPEITRFGHRHYWAGWTWRVLRYQPQHIADLWIAEQQAPDGRRTKPYAAHGLSLRDTMELPHPAYDQHHIERFIVEHHYGPGFDYMIEAVAKRYAATGDYDQAIKDLRAEMIDRAGGMSGGSISYHTYGGELRISRPLEIRISLVEVARRLFPRPGQLQQLTLF